MRGETVMRQLRTASSCALRPRFIGQDSRAAGTVLRCLKIGRISTKLPAWAKYVFYVLCDLCQFLRLILNLQIIPDN